MLHKIEERLLSYHKPSKREVRYICSRVVDLLALEENIVPIEAPVVVCGDIHGQYDDLLTIFKMHGTPRKCKYVFLGDYVDRGPNSVETITLLLLYKVMFPQNIVLLRGNHESRELTETYGLYKEVVSRYNACDVWKLLCETFNYLPLACLVGSRIFCVHGGISPFALTFDKILRINRFVELPSSGPMSDMLWSDPGPGSGCQPSDRGAGYIFGADIVQKFLFLNDVQIVCRSHQLVNEGYRFAFPNRELVTVWSAPNYCNRMGNKATVLRIGKNLRVDDDCFVFFEQAVRPNKEIGSLPYFH
ncbi:serine/threonine-protein phosphatase 4 catalytic subunit [Nematocida homosporus]|uniref:serine/threonine-protein phosphatase 4 catalytic subunit n=1 Tax=Nematocida homosporus TaxID=1912981 RepID=UPI00221F9BCB|nr:serine/threonine-protein phosphatase 4 catalytic subunit [Nematocida homosporus]KAI5185266.1 serine/threonine-protein phosphatase 4 catalytic subunit [Nematocida homosporus]